VCIAGQTAVCKAVFARQHALKGSSSTMPPGSCQPIDVQTDGMDVLAVKQVTVLMPNSTLEWQN